MNLDHSYANLGDGNWDHTHILLHFIVPARIQNRTLVCKHIERLSSESISVTFYSEVLKLGNVQQAWQCTAGIAVLEITDPGLHPGLQDPLIS